ncbi:hypothetical protein EYR36_008118 [Pleurotus pulmonarius]|nr:hypothetical protein EYR36_008118 [Pleurotus pulmonarius]
MKPIFLLYALPGFVSGHQTSEQAAFTSVQDPIDISKEPWTSKYGLQHDLGFTGPLSFSHLPYARCLQDASNKFDIAILGFPFDTTTSYRPGARFGPAGIRHGSRRQSGRGYTVTWGSSPYELGATMMDCGDVPLSGYDNAKAIDQMEAAYSTLLMRPVSGDMRKEYTAHFAKDGKEHPRIITLGGDHTIVLPILRSLNKVYGPVSVIHFDAHLDTWAPRGTTAQERITHGSFFAVAAEEHLIRNTSVHAGIRCKMADIGDVEHDGSVGFQITPGLLLQLVRPKPGDGPRARLSAYYAGFRGLTSCACPFYCDFTNVFVLDLMPNSRGADVVEVAPAYDHGEHGLLFYAVDLNTIGRAADITSIAAADIVYDFLTMLQTETPPPSHDSLLFRNLDD